MYNKHHTIRVDKTTMLDTVRFLLDRFIEKNGKETFDINPVINRVRHRKSKHILNKKSCPYRVVEAVWIISLDGEIVKVFSNYSNAQLYYRMHAAKMRSYMRTKKNSMESRLKITRLI